MAENESTLVVRIRNRVRHLVKQKRTQLPLAGVEYISDNRNPALVRIVWLFVVCACFCVCILQISARLLYLISEPVAVDFQWVIMEDKDFPSIILTSPATDEIKAILSKTPTKYSSFAYEHCQNPIDTILGASLYFSSAFNLDGLWKLANTSRITEISSSMNGNPAQLFREELYFPHALALKFGLDDQSKISSSNNLEIFVSVNRIHHSCMLSEVYLLFEEPGGLKWDMRSAFALRQTTTLIDVQFKTFVYLNRRNSRCVTDEENRQCMHSCFDKELKKITPTCRFPFMDNPDFSLCHLDNSTQQKYNSILYLLGRLNCNCHRTCVKKVFNGKRIFVEETKKNTNITLTFTGKERLMIQQRFTYDLISFFADVGGNLGLCIGWSLLSVFQVFFVALTLPKRWKTNYARKDLLWKKVSDIFKSESEQMMMEYNSKTQMHCGRIAWVITCSLCVTLTSCFLFLRLKYYYTYPIRTIVEVEQIENVIFPTFAICGLSDETVINLMKVIKKRGLKLTKKRQKTFYSAMCAAQLYDHLDLHQDLEFIWNLSAVNKLYRPKEIYAKEHADPFAIKNMSVTDINLPAGRCAQYSIGEQTYYGIFTAFWTRYFQSSFWSHYEICPHQQVYEMYYTYPGDPYSLNRKIIMQYNTLTLVILQMRKITLLNTPNHPCSDTSIAHRCASECANKELLKRIDCRMPYMDTYSLPLCNSTVSARQSHFAYQDINISLDNHLSKCGCLRRCETNVIGFSQTYEALKYGFPHTYEANVMFDSNVLEHFKEVLIYDFSTFLCDIGGNLGVTVGWSLLYAFEVVHSLALTFYKKLQRNHHIGTTQHCKPFKHSQDTQDPTARYVFKA